MEYFGSPFKDSIVRSYRITDEVKAVSSGSGKVDIVAKFKDALGFDIAVYRAFCSAVLSRYINSQNGKKFVQRNGEIDWVACCNSMMFDETWFGSAMNGEMLSKCMEQTAATAEELNSAASTQFGNDDFTLFRNRPLIKTDGGYMLLDIGFLVDKIETGPFWLVQSCLASSKLRQQSLSTWGDVVERYVNWLIKASVDGQLNRAFSNPHFAGSTDEVADTAVICGDTLVLIECKGGFFSAKAKYSGQPAELLAEIQKKLVENESGAPKGIQQLANSLERAFSSASSETIDDFDIAGVNTVFPVLLVRDDIGAAPVINTQLGQQFELLIKGKQYRTLVRPLIVVSLKALEFLCRYLDTVSLSSILSARIAADPDLYWPFWLAPNAVTDQLGEKDNTFVNEEFWKVVLQIAQTLFPGAPAPPKPI
jgi:hypothetical protein